MDDCVLFQKGFDEEKEVQVHEKGLKTLIKISNEREQQELSRYLNVVLLTLFFSSLYVFHRSSINKNIDFRGNCLSASYEK